MSTIKVKMLTTWLFLQIFISLSVEAAHGTQDIVLLSDTSFNSHFFGATLISEKMQLFQKIKPFGFPDWDPSEILSDPLVSVSSYEVIKDVDDNFMIAWMGENTSLEIYSLYIRYYVPSLKTWSPIIMVSSKEHLVGSYSISINTQEAEIIWNSYDSSFNVEDHSATFSLLDI